MSSTQCLNRGSHDYLLAHFGVGEGGGSGYMEVTKRTRFLKWHHFSPSYFRGCVQNVIKRLCTRFAVPSEFSELHADADV